MILSLVNKSLLYYSHLKVYYLLYNIIELVQINVFWYCVYDLTFGREKENGP